MEAMFLLLLIWESVKLGFSRKTQKTISFLGLSYFLTSSLLFSSLLLAICRRGAQRWKYRRGEVGVIGVGGSQESSVSLI